MDYNKIDVLEPGWGTIWQGGAVDAAIDAPPFTDPVLIVTMDAGEDDTPYLNHTNVQAIVNVWIQDDPSACLEDGTLKALAQAIAGWLTDGGNAYLHCFPSGTLVDAPVPMCIEGADEVFGHDGRLHKVTARMSRPYNGELVTVKATGTLPICCTPEHPLLVLRPFRWASGRMFKPGWSCTHQHAAARYYVAARPEWLAASEVRAGDMLVAASPQLGDDPVEQSYPCREHPNNRHVPPLQPDAETAWMLGYYVADGSTLGQNGICFTTADNADAERLTATWARYGLKALVYDHGSYQRVMVASRTVAQAFREWCGSRDHKRFPGFIFDGWPANHLLAGLVAGDGHLDRRGHLTLTTISPSLVRQAHMLLRSLGESPTLSPLSRHSGYPNASPSWAVRWAPTAQQRHTAWWRGAYLMPVTETGTRSYEGLVHNLEVAESNSYAVAGASVHNCAAGVSRASYIDCAVHCVVQGVSADEALARIRAARPVASPNAGFMAQLQRLWP